MKELLNEWRNFIYESETKFFRLPNHDCDITFKTDNLKTLLQNNKGIKKLRVPGWSLQTDVYPSNLSKSDEKVFEFDNIYGLLNFYVDTWHRGMGLADKLFLNVMELSGDRRYIIASRGGKHMLEKHGYKKMNINCDYLECAVYKNKHYKG
jgi:hypothetical protein